MRDGDAVHYGSLGQSECGSDYPNMRLSKVAANVTCQTCRGWLPIVAPELQRAAPTCEQASWLVLETTKQLWWGPNRGGYTSNILRAGLYTVAEAKAIERIRRRDDGGVHDRAVHVSTEREQIMEAATGVVRMLKALNVSEQEVAAISS